MAQTKTTHETLPHVLWTGCGSGPDINTPFSGLVQVFHLTKIEEGKYNLCIDIQMIARYEYIFTWSGLTISLTIYKTSVHTITFNECVAMFGCIHYVSRSANSQVHRPEASLWRAEEQKMKMKNTSIYSA